MYPETLTNTTIDNSHIYPARKSEIKWLNYSLCDVVGAGAVCSCWLGAGRSAVSNICEAGNLTSNQHDQLTNK